MDDSFYQLDRRFNPGESVSYGASASAPDIYRPADGGGRGVSRSLPLKVRLDANDDITVTRASYVKPADETYFTIDPITTPQTGPYVYLIIEQAYTGGLATTNPVRLEVSTTVKNHHNTTGTAPNIFISFRNVLIANGAFQYCTGNVSLQLWVTNGLLHYEPLFTGG